MDCKSKIDPSAVMKQLGSLVDKMLTWCTGGPGFDPHVENPKFPRDLHQRNPSCMTFEMVP